MYGFGTVHKKLYGPTWLAPRSPKVFLRHSVHESGASARQSGLFVVVIVPVGAGISGGLHAYMLRPCLPDSVILVVQAHNRPFRLAASGYRCLTQVRGTVPHDTL